MDVEGRCSDGLEVFDCEMIGDVGQVDGTWQFSSNEVLVRRMNGF